MGFEDVCLTRLDVGARFFMEYNSNFLQLLAGGY
jgi:hypothetical protein